MNVADDEKFDGLFMSAIQNSQGIDNFFTALFSFMRRKTDFFSQEQESMMKVKASMEKQIALYRVEKQKQDAIKKKQAEEKAKKMYEAQKKATQGEGGATVEEIDDDEAKQIEELEKLKKRQAEAKAAKEAGTTVVKTDKDDEGEKQDPEQAKKDAEDELKQAPNAGNGGFTEKYTWHQTLEEVQSYVKLPENTTAKMLDVKITMTKLRICLKSKPNEPLIDGKWCKKIHAEESFWNIERDGSKSTLQITMEKYEKQNWWNCLIEGDIEINTQKVEPENSKLSDLDGETRQTVEKMMFDQQQKAAGKPTSEEQMKKDKLKQFMDAHPEMDFSNAKFS